MEHAAKSPLVPSAKWCQIHNSASTKVADPLGRVGYGQSKPASWLRERYEGILPGSLTIVSSLVATSPISVMLDYSPCRLRRSGTSDCIVLTIDPVWGSKMRLSGRRIWVWT